MAKYIPKTREELKELVQDSSIYLGDIDTSNITTMLKLFSKSARRDFSGIELWDTSSVTDMRGMFAGASYFNHNINSWDTSKVTNMQYMFMGAERFNQPLDNWDTSNVVNMNAMFGGAKSFNQPLDSWDTSKVVDMSYMFLQARLFNQPLNSWDTSSVVNMEEMFPKAIKFNQPLDSWDTSSVEFMTRMFKGTESFNQNLNSWDVSSVRDNQEMFWDSGVSKLPKWYKKRVFSDDFDVITEEGRNIVKEAIANPRPKKPKIAPQDKPKSNTNDWGNLFGGSSKPALTKKSIFRIVGITLFFVIVAVVAIRFDNMQRNSKSNSKATTQTAQQQQTQPTQQPTANMPRCDNRNLLNHIIQSHKNNYVDSINADLDAFAKWQEAYKKYGINLTSVEEFVNSRKYNIINVRTKSSDEANRQVDCGVEIEEVYPVPQSKPFRDYYIIDYNAQLTNDNSIEFEILDVRRSVDK